MGGVSPARRHLGARRLAISAGLPMLASVVVMFATLSSWNLGYTPQYMTGPKIGYQFPELDFFDLHPGDEAPCSDGRRLGAYSLQYAMRLCLNSTSCNAFSWHELSREVQLCELKQYSLNITAAGHQSQVLLGSTAYSAFRKRPQHDGTSESCREGEVLLLGRRSGTCTVCREGHCRPLAGMRPIKDFNAKIEAVVNRTYGEKDHYRGYSPAMVRHEGHNFFVLRVANYTKCPYFAGVDAYYLTPPFQSKIMLCRASTSMLPYRCKEVAMDVRQMELPDFGEEAEAKHFHFSKKFLGMEDARSFSWRGRVHLLGTVNMGNWWGTSKRTVNLVGLARLDEGLAGMEAGAVLNCPGMVGKQKNYMPLIIGGTLYVVIQAHPLVVGRIDPDTMECSVVQREEARPFSLQAVLPSDSFLSGGSSFVPIEANRFLALGHHFTTQRQKRVYYHHFIIVSARETSAGQHHFKLDWVSEAFRLLNGPGEIFGVQFATGMLIRNDSLYISYGITDCFAGLLKIEDIKSRLHLWEEFGIGSQSR